MMLTFRAGRVLVPVILLCLAAACSREQQDWRAAEAADTVEGYGQFLERHPDSELATQAHTRVAQLSEDREWQRAGSADSADAYRQFLAQHPNGRWAQEARIRIQNFALAAGGSVAPPGAAVIAQAAPRELAHSPEAALASPGEMAAAPAPVPAAASARSATATTGMPAAGPSNTAAVMTGYAIQLGAFTSESAATSQWQHLTARFGTDLHGLAPHVVPADTATGRLFRLQALVPVEARARALCDVLKKRAQACVPVLPQARPN